MKTSDDGRAKLKRREGVRLSAYLDSVGVWTIGVGHTSAAGEPKVTPGLTITAQECDRIFARDLVKYESAVNAAVKVPIVQYEFDALTSLCYNIGPGGFARSSVVRKLNAGDRIGAAHAFMMWNKPPEIIGRRASEMRQFSEAAAQPAVLHKAASETRAQANKQGRAAGASVIVAAPTGGLASTHSTLAIGSVVLVLAIVAGFLLWRRYVSLRHANALADAANGTGV